jgi:hypothetical protein
MKSLAEKLGKVLVEKLTHAQEFSPFMESEILSLFSQDQTTRLYPESVESDLLLHSLFL